MTEGYRALRLGTDNDFNEHVVRGLRVQLEDLDVLSVREPGLARASDDEILAWAASEGRIVLTHDLSTMTAAAYDRLRKSSPLPGLIVVPQLLPVGEAVRRLVALLRGARAADVEGRVTFL